MDRRQRKITLMQLQVSTLRKVLFSILIMLVLIAGVLFFQIPNPNMILIAGLVLCSAMFGYGGGIVAAAVMLVYTLYFFSTDHSFLRFTPENLKKVVVTLVGIIADLLLVCTLKLAEVEAFREVDELTEELKRENELLHSASMTDALTGIRNRQALRRDYDSYRGHQVTVMMLDLDRFKGINDSRGHEEGDRMLRETGRLLSETFGQAHCYRYGGDEFLVIWPDEPEEDFRTRLEAMLKNRPTLEEAGEAVMADFSVGYVHDALDLPGKLRELIAKADERMYADKRGKAPAGK